MSNVIAILGVGTIALLSGYMVAASGTSVVTTALPLVFGLVTVVVGLLAVWKKEQNVSLELSNQRIDGAKRLAGAAAIVFSVCFGTGIHFGQKHKRHYAKLDLQHLVSDQQPKTFLASQQWLALVSTLDKFQANTEIRDHYYTQLLAHEDAILKSSEESIDTSKVLLASLNNTLQRLEALEIEVDQLRESLVSQQQGNGAPKKPASNDKPTHRVAPVPMADSGENGSAGWVLWQQCDPANPNGSGWYTDPVTGLSKFGPCPATFSPIVIQEPQYPITRLPTEDPMAPLMRRNPYTDMQWWTMNPELQNQLLNPEFQLQPQPSR